VAWSAVPDLRDRVDNAFEDFFEGDRLIVVIAAVNRVAAGVDRIGGQRGREVARGHLERPVADGEQAVAGLDRLAYVRFACLADVDAEVMRERLVDDSFGCVDHCHWSLQLLGQLHDLRCNAKPVRVRIHQDRRRRGGGQSPRDRGDARTQPFLVAGRVGEREPTGRNLDVEVGDVGRQLHVDRELLPPGGDNQPVDLAGCVAWGEPGVRAGHMRVGV
jgi:hypothetical protein